MASSLMRGLLIGAIAAGKIQSILTRRKNKLIFVINDQKVTQNFDIIKSWNFKKTVKITENPVEQGVLINDHRIIQPIKLTIEVGVSDIVNPINILAQQRNLLQTAKLLLFAGTSLANSPSTATYSVLKSAIDNSEVFDVETPMGTLQNFLITSIDNTTNSQNYKAFEGIIELQEILMFNNFSANTSLSGVNPRPKVNNQTFTETGT